MIKEIALIRATKEDNVIQIDCEGQLGDILTAIGAALYQIEMQQPEEARGEFRSLVISAINAPRKIFKGEPINENK